jgi:hypothetical protein
MHPGIIVSATLLLIGAATAIFMFMRANDINMDDSTLLETCIGALGEEDEACQYIAAEGITWDTGIACNEAEGAPTWNYRGLIDAMTLDYEEHAGEDGTEYTQEHAAEYIETTCSTDIVPSRKLEEGEAPQRHLLTSNYGPCSMDFKFLSGGTDTAECSGLAIGGTCALNQAQVNAIRSDNRWLQQGCLNHDVCLVQGGVGYPGNCGADCPGCFNGNVNGGYSGKGDSRGSRDCDKKLAGAAKSCAFDVRSCGKGCSRRLCGDSKATSITIWGLMGNIFWNPNDGWCGV